MTLSLYFTTDTTVHTFTDVALLTGYHLLGVAAGGIVTVPAARVLGKRHLYLLGALVIIISSAVGGSKTDPDTDYKGLLVARVFQGIGLAPFEVLVNASVGDMYCVHVGSRTLIHAQVH